MTVRYSTGIWTADYIEPTVYDILSNETRWRQQLEINADYIKPWGNVGVGARWSNFMDDFSINNLRISAETEVRITGGLSLTFEVNGSMINDQINLPAEEASDEDVLANGRVIPTDYRFSTNFGIRYRFGSNLNNLVNPRFDN